MCYFNEQKVPLFDDADSCGARLFYLGVFDGTNLRWFSPLQIKNMQTGYNKILLHNIRSLQIDFQCLKQLANEVQRADCKGVFWLEMFKRQFRFIWCRCVNNCLFT